MPKENIFELEGELVVFSIRNYEINATSKTSDPIQNIGKLTSIGDIFIEFDDVITDFSLNRNLKNSEYFSNIFYNKRDVLKIFSANENCVKKYNSFIEERKEKKE